MNSSRPQDHARSLLADPGIIRLPPRLSIYSPTVSLSGTGNWLPISKRTVRAAEPASHFQHSVAVRRQTRTIEITN